MAYHEKWNLVTSQAFRQWLMGEDIQEQKLIFAETHILLYTYNISQYH